MSDKENFRPEHPIVMEPGRRNTPGNPSVMETEPEMQPQCLNCRFGSHNKRDGIVYCRRYPPVIHYRIDMSKWYGFVESDEDEWCGEWQAKNNTGEAHDERTPRSP